MMLPVLKDALTQSPGRIDLDLVKVTRVSTLAHFMFTYRLILTRP